MSSFPPPPPHGAPPFQPSGSPPPPPSGSPFVPPRKPSRARWLIPLGILFVLVAFGGGLALLFLGSLASADRVTQGSVLHLKLKGILRESPDPMATLLPGLAGPPSLFEVRKALRRAAQDSNISGLRLDVDALAIGWGEAQDLISAVDDFKKSKKPVHAFLGGEFVSDLDYQVAASADKVWVAPLTTFAVNGLEAQLEFWKGTLDKLQIEPQFFMRREYKSAGETYSRNEMSKPSREATTAFLQDVWSNFLADVSRRRKLDLESLRSTADLGIETPIEAQAAKWVDGVGYPDALERDLARTAGAESYHSVSVRKYLRSTASQDLFSGSGKPRLALVFGEGVIVSSPDAGLFDESFHGPLVAAAIRKAADDAQVRGILFRVNSPGGSGVGSDYVWRAVEYARKEKKKPVVVSMSSVAGSGGYWVAMNSDAIVAEPSTLTGSIGVVFGKLNVLGLYHLAGANVDTARVGRNANMLSAVSSFDEEQSARVNAWLDAFYGEFKRKVGEGRKLDADRVEEIARGRIWSGIAGKKNGLVDLLGGYDEALALLKTKAGIAKDAPAELVIYPRQKNLFEALVSDDEPAFDSESVRSLLDPERALRKALAELTTPGALLLMPPLSIR